METNEREPLFTNTYGPSEEGLTEAYRSARLIWRIVLFTLAAGFLGYIGYNLVQWILWSARSGESVLRETAFWLLIAELALLITLVVREATAAKQYAKKQLRRIAETYNGGDPTVQASFYDDAVTFHNDATGSTMQLRYDTFRKCREVQNFFLITTREKQMFELPKASFAGIDVPGVRQFLQERCTDAKCSWRTDV